MLHFQSPHFRNNSFIKLFKELLIKGHVVCATTIYELTFNGVVGGKI
jgi:hypothetical protein